MLDKFAAAKQKEIAELRSLAVAGTFPDPYPGSRPSFSMALLQKGPGAVIAEFKRASPSRGDINLDTTPSEAADMFAKSGAAAASVLTEQEYFKGRLDYLFEMAESGLPLLRKDFILHTLQVRQTAATPASALLLIARMFKSPAQVGDLIAVANDHGLEAVVEVFDEPDLDMARQAGAGIIQVNNRDLDTLTVSLDVSRRMAGLILPGEVWISASGIFNPREVAEMADLGFTAVLIGTSIMSEADPGAALADLARKGQ